MILKSILVLVIFLPMVSQANEWLDVKNDNEISSALSGKTIRFDEYSFQVFGENGRTRYFTERVSDGFWEARDGQYCSAWPVALKWTCYDLSTKGDRFRFALSDGTFSEGYIDN